MFKSSPSCTYIKYTFFMVVKITSWWGTCIAPEQSGENKFWWGMNFVFFFNNMNIILFLTHTHTSELGDTGDTHTRKEIGKKSKYIYMYIGVGGG